ncbi:MAG TPA: FAD-dependent oxidoreductase [Blastocatellia bacterium]|nr:FAD-dependent oxidoreductase [Blastocatellia bacterium]
MSKGINRRDFIKDLSLVAAWLALNPRVSRASRRGGLRLLGEPKNIVILGGGLAGLSAGLELKRAGHNVTILEARKAPGGRLRTIREFDDGLYAEAGPLSFPQSHDFTFGYATDFGLPLRPAFTFGLDAIASIRGDVFRISSTGEANIPFSLQPREREAGVYGIIDLYLSDYMRQVGNPLKSGWPSDSLAATDQLSLRALLESLDASDGAIDIIAASQLGILGFGLDSVSAMDGIVTEAFASDPRFYEIVGGNDQLATAFKRKVKKQYKKQSLVKRIEQTDSSVTVTYQNSDGIQTISADRVICTLPFPILKDIETSPAFSEEKQRAIQDLKSTPVTRAFLQFKSRVWQQSNFSGYGLTDLSIQNTYQPTLTQPGARGILAAYAGGQRALDLGAMSEDDRQNLALRKMAGLFGTALNQKYEQGTSQIWHEDPFARGAFAYFAPGQMTTLLPAAQKPEGRIHFAGEHTSAWHGWMNGALESGNRVAQEVNEAEAQESIVVRAG